MFDFEDLEEAWSSGAEGDGSPEWGGPSRDRAAAGASPRAPAPGGAARAAGAPSQAAVRSPATPSHPSSGKRRGFTLHLDVEILTIGGGVVATLQLPPFTTAQELKTEVEAILNVRASEQKLVVGTAIFDGLRRLSEVAPAGATSVQVTVVHIPGAKQVAVSCSADGSMLVWDLEQGVATKEPLPGHRGGITCVSVAWATRRAMSAGEDGTLRMWDLDRGVDVREFRGHSAGVTSLDVDWALQRALSGSHDRTLRLWSLADGAAIRELGGHSSSVLCVAFDAAMERAVSGSSDCSLRLWDLASGEALQEFLGHQVQINCVAANFRSAAGPLAVTGSFVILRVWMMAAFPFHADGTGHTSAVTCLAVHWGERWFTLVLSGSSDATVRLWKSNPNGAPETLRVMRGHNMPVLCLAVDWYKRRAVSGSGDGCVKVWDIEGGAALRSLEGHGEAVTCVAIDLDGCGDVESEPADRSGSLDGFLNGVPLWRAWKDAGLTDHVSTSVNLAQGRPAGASSAKAPDRAASCAVDGNPDTRWTSEYSDGQWLSIDLGRAHVLHHVDIRWERACAESYSLDGSIDGKTWRTMAEERGREGWVVTKLLTFSRVRWVRVSCRTRRTSFGFSIWEVRVHEHWNDAPDQRSPRRA